MPPSLSIDAKWFKVDQQGVDDMLEGYEFGVPGKYFEYIEDFFYYTAADWTISDTGVNTRALATAAPTVGGVLLITLAGADNDLSSIQKVGHSFVPTAGTNIWFECIFQTSDATQSDWLVGLVLTDATPLTTTQGIYFRKDDGDAQIDFETNATSTLSTENNIATDVSATYVRVGFKVTGTSLVEYYVNGIKQGEFSANIPTVPLRVTIHMQNGEAVAKTMSLDYIACIQSRPHGSY